MNIKKLTIALLINVAIQMIMGAILLMVIWDRISGTDSLMVFGCVALILLTSLFSVLGILAVSRYQTHNYLESMRNLENLNGKLREQKHDLMNHFQVVYGLMELQEYGEAHRYVRPVFKDIQKLNRALKTSLPAVNALLQSKLEAAEKQEIDMYLTVGSQLSDLQMMPWDLCRVLANLIDNGMTALAERDKEKRLMILINESEDDFVFEISNNGPMIPEEAMPHLFRAGFTTKKEEGHGQGLAIVSRLVREAGGTVDVESDEEETVFRVVLPRK